MKNFSALQLIAIIGITIFHASIVRCNMYNIDDTYEFVMPTYYDEEQQQQHQLQQQDEQRWLPTANFDNLKKIHPESQAYNKHNPVDYATLELPQQSATKLPSSQQGYSWLLDRKSKNSNDDDVITDDDDNNINVNFNRLNNNHNQQQQHSGQLYDKQNMKRNPSSGPKQNVRYAKNSKQVFQPLCPIKQEIVYLTNSTHNYRPDHYEEIVCMYPNFHDVNRRTHGKNKVCTDGGFHCVQLYDTIFLTRQLQDSEDCWAPEVRTIPSGCECMWPEHELGDINRHEN